MAKLPKWLIILLVLFFLLDAVLLVFYFKNSQTLTKLSLSRKITPPVIKEKLQPGSCLVLEEKYCQKGEPIYQEGKLTIVGFKLPKDTPIFSPFTGIVSNTPKFTLKKEAQETIYFGSSVSSKETVFLLGRDWPEKRFSAVYFDSSYTEKMGSEKVETGAVIGHVSEQIIEVYGDYNLLVYWLIANPEGETYLSDDQRLKELFSL